VRKVVARILDQERLRVGINSPDLRSITQLKGIAAVRVIDLAAFNNAVRSFAERHFKFVAGIHGR
jgi:hypothetical protein